MYELLTALITGAFSLAVVWLTYRINQIHTLVNSNMTVALQAGHAALLTARSAMLEVISLKRLMKIEPAPGEVSALAGIDAKILESKEALAGR